MLQAILKLIAPDECAICGMQDTLLCRRCSGKSIIYIPSRCFHCLRPTSNFRQCDVCASCYAVDSVWVCGVYQGQLKQLIHEYKFLHKRAAFKDLACIMDIVLPAIHPDTIVVNVPTASSRMRERGFDHASLLAKAFARKRGLVYLPCLARNGQIRQLGLKRADRLKNIDGAVRIKGSFTGKDARFLIIDDVVTTGASINETAKVLKNAGALYVNAAVVAQALL